MTRSGETLLISRRDIAAVMRPADYLHAAEQAFRALAEGQALTPAPMHIPATRGGFHVKGAGLALGGGYVVVKVNGNYPGNPAELGLPTIQGAALLFDAADGRLLAILDSIELTLRRTAAASALAARLLARPDSTTTLICGCGEQGRAHAEALAKVLPGQRWLLWDRDRQSAAALAAHLDGTVADDLKRSAHDADIILCCTSAREPYLDPGMVPPGAFIAAVGADSPAKSEIVPPLMAAATIVTDLTAQCAAMGDLRHAIAAGTMSEAGVHAELAEVVSGTRPGRTSAEEIVLFDSTGIGVQDVTASAVIYHQCLAACRGRPVALGEP